MPEITMRIPRETRDEETGEVLSELELLVQVYYSEPEQQTWTDSGSDGEVDISKAFIAETGTPTDLTDDERDYVEENLFKQIKEQRACYEDYQYEMTDRRRSF